MGDKNDDTDGDNSDDADNETAMTMPVKSAVILRKRL